MEVTIVDSEPAVINLIDTLDNLPTQPPSLYVDIEGVKLSRHGSISILQLFVLPRNHVFLVDVFVLKEAAFSTPNRSGTDLRSILESARVPKVFFDVRNDSDALFAHFQILMQGVQDIQLLEVATRSFSRDRVFGLVTCITRDARLTSKALAAWKATKQQGQSLFAPDNGGHYEVFNSRPIPQDIVDYCTQDVVYLPVLWKIYTQKISVKWMKKVQIETCGRVLASQNASYEPHSREKTLSPWAKVKEPRPGDRPGTNKGKAPVKQSVMSNAQTAAIETPKKAAAKGPSSKAASQPAGQSAQLAASIAATKTPGMIAGLERPLPKTNLAIRSKNELQPGSSKKTDAVLHPATVHGKWVCTTCGREMQESNKVGHVAGKQHIARLKQRTAAPQTNPPKQKTLQAKEAPVKKRQPGTLATDANPRGTTNPGSAQGANTKGKKKKKQTAVPQPQLNGLPYPPDYQFLVFQESAVPWNYQFETSFETSWSLDDADYSVCDKDCGWCGHCIYHVDFDI